MQTRDQCLKPLKFILIILAGLLLRLILMPLTFHGDLLFIHHLPALLLKEGGVEIYGTWGRFFLERDHWMYYPPLVLYLTAGLQLFVSVSTGILRDVLNDYHFMLLSAPRQPVHTFLSGYSFNQRLFFSAAAKFGYLLFDAAGFLVFFRIIRSDLENSAASAARWWFLNPVLIFSTYVMGQYRIYSVLFCLLMLFAFRKGREGWAFICLGCLCLLENYPWLFVPLYLLIHARWERSSLMKNASVFTCFLFLTLGLETLRSGGYVLSSYASPVIVKTALVGVVRSAGPAGGMIAKILLGSTYLGLLFLCLRFSLHAQQSAEIRWRRTLDVSIALLLMLYATSAVSIHYFMWILPFWLCRIAIGGPWSKGLGTFLIFLLFLFNMDSRSLNLGLLMPVDPEYWMSTLSLHEVLQPYFSWGKVIGSARLLFSALCIYLAWKILQPNLDTVFKSKTLEKA